MTQNEVNHPDFECSTPGCEGVQTSLTPLEEDAEVQRARDNAKQFLRETYEDCLSLCILPFLDEPVTSVKVRNTYFFGTNKVETSVANVDGPQDKSRDYLHH